MWGIVWRLGRVQLLSPDETASGKDSRLSGREQPMPHVLRLPVSRKDGSTRSDSYCSFDGIISYMPVYGKGSLLSYSSVLTSKNILRPPVSLSEKPCKLALPAAVGAGPGNAMPYAVGLTANKAMINVTNMMNSRLFPMLPVDLI